MKNILLTSTNNIEGAKINQYVELITANVVVGTNIFSDFGASLTDIFGGMSDTYQGKLQKIYKISLDKLKTKAINLGANAIIGIKIDFDEISGKGKSMFMISIFGTAVKIEYLISTHESKIDTDIVIDVETLEQEVAKRNIVSKLKEGHLPSQEDWSFLMNSPIAEILEYLLNKYFELLNGTDVGANAILFKENIIRYFGILNEDEASDALYSNIQVKPHAVIRILVANNLFSSKNILKLLMNNEKGVAIGCLEAKKQYYSKADLNEMNSILNYLDNLEELGKIEKVKSIIGKPKMKYKCPSGHNNSVNDTFCTTCGTNIKGLTRMQVELIDNFRAITESLESILL